MYHWANRRTLNKAISDDIVQNFWVIFWSSPNTVKVDENGMARRYLMRFFYHRMFDYLGSAAAKRLGGEKVSEIVSESQLYSHMFEELEVSEILSIIDETLTQLPYMVRDIFQFIWEDDHSVKEAALHFDMSEKVIRTIYNKVLNEVQAKIKSIQTDEKTLHKITALAYYLLYNDYLSK